MCIDREVAARSVVGEVTAYTMGVEVDYGVSIIIISLSVTVILGGSFGFRRCGISTLLLMLNFCAVDFSINSSTLAMRSLYSEALLTGCSCTSRMFTISCCCDTNALIACRITQAASSLIMT